MSEELPNLSLLIKLLKMTTSSNDAEALLAIRNANKQLSKFGGDWESLLRSHVTIIGADPFQNIEAPPQSTRQRPTAPRATAPTPRRPASPQWGGGGTTYSTGGGGGAGTPQPPPRPTPTPQPPPPPPPPWTVPSPRPNRYAGHCFMCGYNVPISDGVTRYLGTQSAGKWEVFCGSCDTQINAGTAIPKRRATKRTSLKDALSQI